MMEYSPTVETMCNHIIIYIYLTMMEYSPTEETMCNYIIKYIYLTMMEYSPTVEAAFDHTTGHDTIITWLPANNM